MNDKENINSSIALRVPWFSYGKFYEFKITISLKLMIFRITFLKIKNYIDWCVKNYIILFKKINLYMISIINTVNISNYY